MTSPPLHVHIIREMLKANISMRTHAAADSPDDAGYERSLVFQPEYMFLVHADWFFSEEQYKRFAAWFRNTGNEVLITSRKAPSLGDLQDLSNKERVAYHFCLSYASADLAQDVLDYYPKVVEMFLSPEIPVNEKSSSSPADRQWKAAIKKMASTSRNDRFIEILSSQEETETLINGVKIFTGGRDLPAKGLVESFIAKLADLKIRGTQIRKVLASIPRDLISVSGKRGQKLLTITSNGKELGFSRVTDLLIHMVQNLSAGPEWRLPIERWEVGTGSLFIENEKMRAYTWQMDILARPDYRYACRALLRHDTLKKWIKDLPSELYSKEAKADILELVEKHRTGVFIGYDVGDYTVIAALQRWKADSARRSLVLELSSKLAEMRKNVLYDLMAPLVIEVSEDPLYSDEVRRSTSIPDVDTLIQVVAAASVGHWQVITKPLGKDRIEILNYSETKEVLESRDVHIESAKTNVLDVYSSFARYRREEVTKNFSTVEFFDMPGVSCLAAAYILYYTAREKERLIHHPIFRFVIGRNLQDSRVRELAANSPEIKSALELLGGERYTFRTSYLGDAASTMISDLKYHRAPEDVVSGVAKIIETERLAELLFNLTASREGGKGSVDAINLVRLRSNVHDQVQESLDLPMDRVLGLVASVSPDFALLSLDASQVRFDSVPGLLFHVDSDILPKSDEALTVSEWILKLSNHLSSNMEGGIMRDIRSSLQSDPDYVVMEIPSSSMDEGDSSQHYHTMDPFEEETSSDILVEEEGEEEEEEEEEEDAESENVEVIIVSDDDDDDKNDESREGGGKEEEGEEKEGSSVDAKEDDSSEPAASSGESTDVKRTEEEGEKGEEPPDESGPGVSDSKRAREFDEIAWFKLENGRPKLADPPPADAVIQDHTYGDLFSNKSQKAEEFGILGYYSKKSGKVDWFWPNLLPPPFEQAGSADESKMEDEPVVNLSPEEQSFDFIQTDPEGAIFRPTSTEIEEMLSNLKNGNIVVEPDMQWDTSEPLSKLLWIPTSDNGKGRFADFTQTVEFAWISHAPIVSDYVMFYFIYDHFSRFSKKLAEIAKKNMQRASEAARIPCGYDQGDLLLEYVQEEVAEMIPADTLPNLDLLRRTVFYKRFGGKKKTETRFANLTTAFVNFINDVDRRIALARLPPKSLFVARKPDIRSELWISSKKFADGATVKSMLLTGGVSTLLRRVSTTYRTTVDFMKTKSSLLLAPNYLYIEFRNVLTIGWKMDWDGGLYAVSASEPPKAIDIHFIPEYQFLMNGMEDMKSVVKDVMKKFGKVDPPRDLEHILQAVPLKELNPPSAQEEEQRESGREENDNATDDAEMAEFSEESFDEEDEDEMETEKGGPPPLGRYEAMMKRAEQMMEDDRKVGLPAVFDLTDYMCLVLDEEGEMVSEEDTSKFSRVFYAYAQTLKADKLRKLLLLMSGELAKSTSASAAAVEVAWNLEQLKIRLRMPENMGLLKRLIAVPYGKIRVVHIHGKCGKVTSWVASPNENGGNYIWSRSARTSASMENVTADSVMRGLLHEAAASDEGSGVLDTDVDELLRERLSAFSKYAVFDLTRSYEYLFLTDQLLDDMSVEQAVEDVVGKSDNLRIFITIAKSVRETYETSMGTRDLGVFVDFLTKLWFPDKMNEIASEIRYARFKAFRDTLINVPNEYKAWFYAVYYVLHTEPRKLFTLAQLSSEAISSRFVFNESSEEVDVYVGHLLETPPRYIGPIPMPAFILALAESNGSLAFAQPDETTNRLTIAIRWPVGKMATAYATELSADDFQKTLRLCVTFGDLVTKYITSMDKYRQYQKYTATIPTAVQVVKKMIYDVDVGGRNAESTRFEILHYMKNLAETERGKIITELRKISSVFAKSILRNDTALVPPEVSRKRTLAVIYNGRITGSYRDSAIAATAIDDGSIRDIDAGESSGLGQRDGLSKAVKKPRRAPRRVSLMSANTPDPSGLLVSRPSSARGGDPASKRMRIESRYLSDRVNAGDTPCDNTVTYRMWPHGSMRINATMLEEFAPIVHETPHADSDDDLISEIESLFAPDFPSDYSREKLRDFVAASAPISVSSALDPHRSWGGASRWVHAILPSSLSNVGDMASDERVTSNLSKLFGKDTPYITLSAWGNGSHSMMAIELAEDPNDSNTLWGYVVKRISDAPIPFGSFLAINPTEVNPAQNIHSVIVWKEGGKADVPEVMATDKSDEKSLATYDVALLFGGGAGKGWLNWFERARELANGKSEYAEFAKVIFDAIAKQMVICVKRK